MENWRKYLLNEVPMHDHGPGAFTPKMPATRKEMDDLATMLTYIEPTGQISDITIGSGGTVDARYTYEDVADSVESAKLNLEKGDYKSAGHNSAFAVLAALAMIPIIGKFAKGARKAAMAKKAVDKAAKSTSKALRSSGDAKLIAKAKEIDNAVEKATQSRKVKKLNYNEQDVFTKHIKDNIPIPKDVARDVIKKNPDVAVRATNVYRGMRVNKEYILKHYGQEILSKGPGTHVLEVSRKFSPRKGTSSWAIDSNEAGAWAGGYAQKEAGPIGILFVGGKGPKDMGLDITKRAKQIGSKQSHFDWSEVSMLGDVSVHKVIITIGEAPKGKMHFPPSKLASNDNIKPGFYGPQTRAELVNFFKSN